MKLAAATLLLSASTTPLTAQWLNYPTPGIPRLANGKPNLAAPAPRTPDGKPHGAIPTRRRSAACNRACGNHLLKC
jgi:hypothetical protein